MKLFTNQQFRKLIENGKNPDKDHVPVVRLHILYTRCQWLISELDPAHPHIAFGLCDLGFGSPELGYVNLRELKEITGAPFPVMRDYFFESKYVMSVYADAAREISGITVESDILQRHQHNKPTN